MKLITWGLTVTHYICLQTHWLTGWVTDDKKTLNKALWILSYRRRKGKGLKRCYRTQGIYECRWWIANLPFERNASYRDRIIQFLTIIFYTIFSQQLCIWSAESLCPCCVCVCLLWHMGCHGRVMKWNRYCNMKSWGELTVSGKKSETQPA